MIPSASSWETSPRLGTRNPWSAPGDDGEVDVGGELLRRPERVALALDDQRRQPGGLELLEPGALRPAGRVQRERERQEAAGAEGAGAPGGRTGAGAAPAEHQRGADAHLPAAATRHSSSTAGRGASRLPATLHGISRRTTEIPSRGSSRASVSRSGDSMPPPAPWLSRRVATGLRDRSVTSRASPCGVGTVLWCSPLDHAGCGGSVASGSSRSGPLFFTLFTIVETG